MPKRKRVQIDVSKAIRTQTRLKKLRNDLNRPSVLIPIRDENFFERFKEVFHEHIKGFKTKRTKVSSNLEWKTRLKTTNGRPNKLNDATRQKAIEAYRLMKKNRTAL